MVSGDVVAPASSWCYVDAPAPLKFLLGVLSSESTLHRHHRALRAILPPLSTQNNETTVFYALFPVSVGSKPIRGQTNTCEFELLQEYPFTLNFETRSYFLPQTDFARSKLRRQSSADIN